MRYKLTEMTRKGETRTRTLTTTTYYNHSSRMATNSNKAYQTTNYNPKENIP